MPVSVLSATREELELPFNEVSYRHVLEDGLSKQELAIDGFVRKLMPVAQPVVSGDAEQVAQPLTPRP